MSALKNGLSQFLPPAAPPPPPTVHAASPGVWSYDMLHVIRNGTNHHRHHYDSTDPFGMDVVRPTTLEFLNHTKCDIDESNENSALFETIVYIMYISIFIFALLGNGVVSILGNLCTSWFCNRMKLYVFSRFKTTVYVHTNWQVCYIVYSSPRMKTVTNYFIVNLAVGDILLTLFCVPFSFFSILILQYWPYGSVLCHLVNYCQAVSVLVSAYTLVAISVDRYSAILWPLRPRITKR